MKKVLLNKQEIEALESALEVNGGDRASVVHWHVQNLWDGKREVLNDQDLDLIIRALYVGYEIEPSPEEKVFDFYESLDTSREFSADWHKSVAITNTLNLLNIQIKGINY